MWFCTRHPSSVVSPLEKPVHNLRRISSISTPRVLYCEISSSAIAQSVVLRTSPLVGQGSVPVAEGQLQMDWIGFSGSELVFGAGSGGASGGTSATRRLGGSRLTSLESFPSLFGIQRGGHSAGLQSGEDSTSTFRRAGIATFWPTLGSSATCRYP